MNKTFRRLRTGELPARTAGYFQAEEPISPTCERAGLQISYTNAGYREPNITRMRRLGATVSLPF